mgnify:CR=1 FL=1
MIVRNWTNINPNNFQIDHSNLDITYNNKPVLIQIPKGRIIPHPQVFNNPKLHFINISLSYKKNSIIDKFCESIKSIETLIINSSKSNYKISSSINSHDNNLYFNLSIQIYNNEPIISIFDPYKNKQTVNYIIPQSNAICLISPKNIWKSKNKIGINWVLVQAKIFQPIIKIDECLIMDEFEEQPLLNYHKIPESNKIINNEASEKSDIEVIDELKSKYDKFLKMKKMGVPLGAIEIEMSKDASFKINEFLNLIGEAPRKEESKSPPKFKLVLPKKKSKPAEKQQAPQNTSGQTSGAFRPPSQADIKNMLAKLKPVKKN